MKIDIETAPTRSGTAYPAPFDAPCQQRRRVRLGAAAGLQQFGVNLLHLQPGTWSSQRHWHTREDEFVYVLAGEVVLVTDEGETLLRAGECAGFRHGVANGHHLQNRGAVEAVVLEVGSDDPEDEADYPDIDMRIAGGVFVHRDGTPYPPK
ncbi:cupin domain-containing protein [Nannocystis sp. SCPEA4]|uniref:cupin domain-containing protein n=1 Tax=Nannocystis sp. SCPEA4 TaxID=2996787 RepID=UPI00226E12C3|nr:cupin domain-containing protein [Nannocystis sp. SCPEA4]MCY1057490.1 cupin domain-containing protein [Nannocystis sp. SCPEA4]